MHKAIFNFFTMNLEDKKTQEEDIDMKENIKDGQNVIPSALNEIESEEREENEGKEPELQKQKWFGVHPWIAFFLDWTITIGGIILLLFVIRNFIFIPFTVQGPSMEPSLHDREFIYVDKLIPLVQGEYQRGQIIVFTPPQERMVQTPGIMCLLYKAKNIIFFEHKEDPCLVQASFVKRIVGVAGDTVEVQNGNVYVTPKGGQKTKVDESFLMEENKNKTCVPAGQCSSLFSLPSEAGKSFGVVPENSYFVLGDNRLNSSDSRAGTWGSPFVEENHIAGVVRFVYLTPPIVMPSESVLTTALDALKAVPFSFSGVRWLETKDLIGEGKK